MIRILAALTLTVIGTGCGSGDTGTVAGAADARSDPGAADGGSHPISDSGGGRETGQTGDSSFAGCVNVDTSILTVTCGADTDCISVATLVCDGKMSCGNFAINRSALAAYNAQIAGVQPAGCLAFTAPPTCVQSRCVAN
jgi:hypothetical protein